MRVGEHLKNDIGLDWLFSISLDQQFLQPLGLEATLFWCLLWTEDSEELAQQIYDAVTFRQTVLEHQGNRPREFGFDWSFTEENQPTECPSSFEELPHVQAAMNGGGQARPAGAAMSKQGEKKIGPGEIVVGGSAVILGMIGIYKWLTKPRA